MAKRFIDTGLFDDPWFMELGKDAKILWMYLITKCDHAGIIDVNRKLAEFQTGIKSYVTVSKQLGNRLIHLRDTYYFIPKFIEFQYPDFPRSNVKQQQGAIKILESFGLIKDGVLTVSKDLTKSYGNDIGNDIDNGNDNIPEFSEFLFYALSKKDNIDKEAVKFKYDAWVENGWKDGNDKKISNWKSKLNNTLPYIKEKKLSSLDRVH